VNVGLVLGLIALGVMAAMSFFVLWCVWDLDRRIKADRQ
jgi:uncharacterized membrane protein YqjE